MKRHPFNLVEIALATAVLGVGVASVLALFPVGAATSRSAVAENTIADVAEFFFSYFQNKYQDGWLADGKTSTASGKEFARNCPSFVSAPDDDDVPRGSANFNEMGNFPNLFVYKNPTTNAFDYGLYLYRQGDDTNGIDFEAMVRVGKVVNNIHAIRYSKLAPTSAEKSDKKTTYLLNDDASASASHDPEQADHKTMIAECLVSLVIEFSWPVDAKWSEREKRLYRLDFFNEKYTPNTLP